MSFLCSVLEAVILSLTPSYLESLKQTQPKQYKRMAPLKNNVEKPLASILSLNTIAHTIGATGAGAQAQKVFGNLYLTLFSVLLTLGILIFSEIIPKSIGARYWKSLCGVSSRIIPFLILISYPLVFVSEKISKLIKGKEVDRISREEVRAIADLGLKHGTLSPLEHQFLINLMLFPNKNVGSIGTRKEKVHALQLNYTIDEAYKHCLAHPYSRHLVYGVNLNDIRGYILKSDIFVAKASAQEIELRSLIKPMGSH